MNIPTIEKEQLLEGTSLSVETGIALPAPELNGNKSEVAINQSPESNTFKQVPDTSTESVTVKLPEKIQAPKTKPSVGYPFSDGVSGLLENKANKLPVAA